MHHSHPLVAPQVLLDGVDVRELRQEALREAVAVVPQVGCMEA